MRTSIYVDGFNLYFRMLEKNPSVKWLNIVELPKRLLGPDNEVNHVNYYTARVSGHVDPTAPARQQIYLDALESLPEITVHMGTFLTSEKFAGLVHPPEFRPRIEMAEPWPDVVKVVKIEEKGSDVNLACHLIRDGFQDRYDVAAVISNDSDLIEPIRIVTKELGKPVGLLSPVNKPNPQLVASASFLRRIRRHDLNASQLPNQIGLPDGTQLTRPSEWI